MDSLGWLDALFAGVLLVSAAMGLWRGVVYEVLSLAGWLVAWLVAQMFGVAAGDLVLGLNWTAAARGVAGWGLCFVLTLIVWRLLTWLIKQLLQASPLAPVDRGLGAVFGVLRGVLILMALVMLVNLTPLAARQTWRDAPSVGWAQGLLGVVAPMLPGDWWRSRPGQSDLIGQDVKLWDRGQAKPSAGFAGSLWGAIRA